MKQIDNRQKQVEQLKAAKGHLLSFRDKSHVKAKEKHETHAPPAKPRAEKLRVSVGAIEPSHHEKIGRNDSCPCGSGKKYKKCCLDKSSQ